MCSPFWGTPMQASTMLITTAHIHTPYARQQPTVHKKALQHDGRAWRMPEHLCRARASPQESRNDVPARRQAACSSCI